MDPNDLLQAVLYISIMICAIAIAWMMLPWLTTIIPGFDDMIPKMALPNLSSLG